MDKRKNLKTTEQLVIEHCEQVIEYAEETQRAIADKEKNQKLATLQQ